MSTPAPTQSIGQKLLTLVENDALISFGVPILTLLTGVQAANGDPLKLAAAWIKLHGDLIAAAPTALGGLEGQLAALLAAQLVPMITAAQTAQKPPA